MNINCICVHDIYSSRAEIIARAIGASCTGNRMQDLILHTDISLLDRIDPKIHQIPRTIAGVSDYLTGI
jgi:hypothetical protein